MLVVPGIKWNHVSARGLNDDLKAESDIIEVTA